MAGEHGRCPAQTARSQSLTSRRRKTDSFLRTHSFRAAACLISTETWAILECTQSDATNAPARAPMRSLTNKMLVFSEPSEANQYLAAHVACLLSSLRRWTGRNLVDADLPLAQQARTLFDAPFAVLSHNTAADPVLNYANRAGLKLFELSWQELTVLPSRATAESIHQEARARLLARVRDYGYIDDYQGVRISKSGRRFEIEQATVWNLLDEQGADYGQAATFNRWRYLD